VADDIRYGPLFNSPDWFIGHLCSLVEWSQLRDLRSFISGVEEAASLLVEQTHDRAHVGVGCGLVQIAAQQREKIGTFCQFSLTYNR
jgi:hypothetical protein